MPNGRYEVKKTPVTFEATNHPTLIKWYWIVRYEEKIADNTMYKVTCGHFNSFEQAWQYLNGILYVQQINNT